MSERQKRTVRSTQEKQAVVYCGPSVRGVARQYTVYQGGVPQALAEFGKNHPAVMALTVPLERFAATRTALESKGTAQAALYKQILKELGR